MKFIALPPDGPLLSSEADAVDLLGQLYGEDCDTLAIPVSRMAPEVWELKTRLAGLFIQKLTNYRVRPAFVGDVSTHIAASDALRDYVRECNRRGDVLFVASLAELEAKP